MDKYNTIQYNIDDSWRPARLQRLCLLIFDRSDNKDEAQFLHRLQSEYLGTSDIDVRQDLTLPLKNDNNFTFRVLYWSCNRILLIPFRYKILITFLF